MTATTEKPKCPDHPKAGVVSARRTGTSEERWYCLECRKDLGFAGYNTGEHEPMDIGGKEVSRCQVEGSAQPPT